MATHRRPKSFARQEPPQITLDSSGSPVVVPTRGLLSSGRFQHKAFDEAVKFARTLNLRNMKEWRAWCQSGARPPDIPYNPNTTYKDKGWKGLGYWLGTGDHAGKPVRKPVGKVSKPRTKPSATAQVKPNTTRNPAESAKPRPRSTAGVGVSSSNPAGKPIADKPTAKPVTGKPRHRVPSRAEGPLPMLEPLFPKGDLAMPPPLAPLSPVEAVPDQKSQPGGSVYDHELDAPVVPALIRAMPQLIPIPGLKPASKNTSSKNPVRQAGALRFHLPFDEVRSFAHTLNFASEEEWRVWAKNTRPGFVPPDPSKVYAGHGWQGWSHFLGYTELKPCVDVAAFASPLDIQGEDSWKRWCLSGARPPHIPESPERTYLGNGWRGYPHFRNSQYLEFADAHSLVCSLGLKVFVDRAIPGQTSRQVWQDFTQGSHRLATVPTCPETFYANTGWRGWDHWLGLSAARRGTLAAGMSAHAATSSSAVMGRSPAPGPGLPTTHHVPASTHFGRQGTISAHPLAAPYSDTARPPPYAPVFAGGAKVNPTRLSVAKPTQPHVAESAATYSTLRAYPARTSPASAAYAATGIMPNHALLSTIMGISATAVSTTAPWPWVRPRCALVCFLGLG